MEREPRWTVKARSVPSVATCSCKVWGETRTEQMSSAFTENVPSETARLLQPQDGNAPVR